MLTTKPIALITGASSGIGHSLCEEFAKDGYNPFNQKNLTGHLAQICAGQV